VLQVLRGNQLFANISKCSFYQEKIHYFWHIISEEGIIVDPQQIEAIRECTTLKNVSDRYSMGLVGYYMRFIEDVSQISHTITYFQKKGIKFEWTIDCNENFHLLKELLTSAPILNIVVSNQNFVDAHMHAKKDLVESSLIINMSLVMSLER
jgi:hypothetical protein